MKAYVLVKNGGAREAFQLQEKPDLTPKAGEVRVDVDAFGLNYADVMARQGSYRDAPPKPCVIGYEVVGRVGALGPNTQGPSVGTRVVAFCRFGGYATQVVTSVEGVVAIPESLSNGEAAALAVQYGTAWYAAMDRVHIFPGDHVLVQAAAGGVGTALVQIAKQMGAVVYGTAGSDAKLQYLRDQGVDFPINYNTQDFEEVIRKQRGAKGLDIVFDSLGGKTFAKGFKLLGKSGRIVGFGASSRGKGKGVFKDLGLLLGFGFYNPAFLLMESRALIGVNMLRVADERPEALKRCLEGVVEWYQQGKLKPHVGGVYPHSRLAEAHEFLESRKSLGKIIVEW